jgi:PAS domain S-box-containing protein
MMTLHLLILEDKPDDAELAVKEFERKGFDVKWTRVDTEEGFREALAKKPDLILIDYSLPCFDGLAALDVHRQLKLDIPLIIVSGTIGEEVAVECMKSGATDYVLKDKLSRLSPVVKRALEEMKIYRKSKQAEEALRVSEEKYRTLYNFSRDAIMILIPDKVFVSGNPACVKMFGCRNEGEFISLTPAALSPEYQPDGVLSVEKAQKMISIAMEQGSHFFEWKHKRVNREEFDAAVLLTRMKLYGEKILQATVRDITERKKLEAQFRQSQKMEAIGTLAGGIAHDFNNLLTVIIGNAQLALMNVIKDESLRKGIEETKKAGERAASLTQQLLAFSRKQIIKPEVMDLNKEVNETKKMLKRMIGEDIEFETVLEPELWKVYADSGQINQVIINMVVNAKDAMFTCADSAAGRPQGGKLTIETANADLNENYFCERGVEGEKPGHYVMLVVSDTGIGMDKETREHIFEPFFTTKEVGKGTGLGLSTIYGIVKQNNGFIWVYSEPGKGTTFKVYLPRVKEDTEPEEKEQTSVAELGGSETVLIVEDDDSLRNLAQKALQSYGYRVLVAENGEDALRICKEHEGPIHLMITDVVMPKMGGREAADLLQPFYPQIKVIYMSGYTDNAIVRHGVLKPGLNFLEKPFTPEGLARKVREVLDK